MFILNLTYSQEGEILVNSEQLDEAESHGEGVNRGRRDLRSHKDSHKGSEGGS